MSHPGQRPDHLIVREYVRELLDAKRITQEGLRDAFIDWYVDMVPPGNDVPNFEPVHRHDSVEVARRKNDRNLKKLWRAIDGETSFPLAYLAPLIQALESLGEGFGVELQRRLLHNAGLYRLPIDTSENAPVVYARWLQEFAAANGQVVDDIDDDGILNNPATEDRVLVLVEQSLGLLREVKRNRAQKGAELQNG